MTVSAMTTISNIHAKIAASTNPKIAALGAALQARDAAIAAATTTKAKAQAYYQNAGTGLKAAMATKSSSPVTNPITTPVVATDSRFRGHYEANPSQKANRQGFSRIG